EPPSSLASLRIYRFMQLLSEISKNCFLLFQSELIAYPDPMVRASAVLLIGRAGKNPDLMGRMLLDPDPRVQANAVEALWIFKEDDCKPMLFTAAKSKHHRVAGNAAVGLYRIAEIRSIAMLLEMARHKELLFRLAAIWAMGETGDCRFVHHLTELVRNLAGDERVAALRALARIRCRNLSRVAQPAIHIRVARAANGPGSSRHLVLKLVSASSSDLQTLRSTDFAIWEGSTLVCDYSVSVPNAAVLLVAAFVAPRILSEVDPYRVAIAEGLSRCLALKRPDDVWRLDRYTVEGQATGAAVTRSGAAFFYDDLVLGTGIKTQFGFLSSPELLSKLVVAIGSRERTVADLLTAAERINEALARLSGKRHLFLFLHENSKEWPVSAAALQPLADFVRSERIVLHGFTLESSPQWNGLREVCLALEGGTFTISPVEELPDVVEKLYSELVSSFDIFYNAPGSGYPAGDVRISISSDLGCGEVDFSLASDELHVTERQE
ncbi:MAG: HEAT repeat domain-containing protein, partial [Bryobacteraceae bacterium]